MNFNIYYL